MVEFQILPVESPIGVSTGRKSNLGDLGIALGFEIKKLGSFLPFWSHPQPRITDLERPLTFLMIMILLSQHTEFPFVGKILRLQSSRLD